MPHKKVEEMPREQQKAVFANLENQGKTYHSRDKYQASTSTSNQMSKPKYSKINWKKTNKKNVMRSEDHVMAKGKWEDLHKNKNYSNILTKTSKKIEKTITVKDEDLIQADGKKLLEIGDSTYEKRNIYKILEEIHGEKIITKDEERPIKKAIGKKYKINAEVKPSTNVGGFPVIIKDNEKRYMLAPRINP